MPSSRFPHRIKASDADRQAYLRQARSKMAAPRQANPLYQTVITTPEFVRGQQEAKKVYDADGEPLWGLIARENSEFRAGFKYEWSELIKIPRQYGGF